jgi:hypothetical protein
MLSRMYLWSLVSTRSASLDQCVWNTKIQPSIVWYPEKIWPNTLKMRQTKNIYEGEKRFFQFDKHKKNDKTN